LIFIYLTYIEIVPFVNHHH